MEQEQHHPQDLARLTPERNRFGASPDGSCHAPGRTGLSWPVQAEFPPRKEREHEQADSESNENDRRGAVNCEMNRSKCQGAARKEIKCPMHRKRNEAKDRGRVVGHNAIHDQDRAASDRNLFHRVIREGKQIRRRYEERSNNVICDSVESYWYVE